MSRFADVWGHGRWLCPLGTVPRGPTDPVSVFRDESRFALSWYAWVNGHLSGVSSKCQINGARDIQTKINLCII